SFQLDLTSLMVQNILPALCAAVVTILLASMLAHKKGIPVTDQDLESQNNMQLPSMIQAIAGPLVVIVLLALRPLCGITIDPLVALPVGGFVCTLACGKVRHLSDYAGFGLSKVIGVAV